MADAFISYSRRDADFASRLAQELSNRGKSIWLDTEDIAPAARWADEIRAAIESSDAFVFVISPSSVASAECAKELQHALDVRKRVIPVHFGATDPKEVAPELAGFNWVPPLGLFTDDFDRSVDMLVRAMDTDLEWVKSHTRWLERATGWQQAGMDSSLLIRGSELDGAEQWLDAMTGKQPAPSELHHLFIAASRKSSVRRLRRTRAGVSVALVVALILAAIALVQRDAAVANAATARSRQLAAEAEAQLSTDPESSLALALQALRVKRTTEAESALRDALPRMQVLHSFEVGSGVTDAEFSPDGSEIVTAARNGIATVWSRAGKALRVFKPREPDRLASAVFDPRGQRVITAGSDGRAVIWDIGTGRALRVLREPSGAPLTSASFSPNDDRILTSSTDGDAVIWGATAGSRRVVLDNHAAVESAEFSPNGLLVVTAGDSGSRVKVWEASTRKVLYTIKAGGPSYDAEVGSASFSPDGDRIVTADDTGAQAWWFYGQAIGQPLTNPATEGFTDARFSPDGSTVVASSADGLTRVWNPATGEILDVLRGHHGAVLSASFGPHGTTVLTASTDGTAKIWRAMPVELRLSLVPPHYAGPGNALYLPYEIDCTAFQPDGRELATGGQDGLSFWDVRSGKFLGLWFWDTKAMRFTWKTGPTAGLVVPTTSAEVMAIGYSPDGRWVAAGTAYGALWLFGTTGGAQPRSLLPPEGSSGTVSSVVFSRDGREVLEAGFDGHTRLVDVATGRTVVDIKDPGLRDFYDAEFSPNGQVIATAGADGVARLWDARTGRPMKAFPEPGLEVLRSVEFSPDGRELLTASDDGSARVIDVATGRPIVVINEPQAAPLTLARFSTDGKMIVTGSTDGTTRIWDSANSTQLEELGVLDLVNSTSIYEAVFSPDDKEVATITNVAGHATDVWSTELAGPLSDLVRIASQRLAGTGRLT
jgi:WD40 repeat protein